MQDDDDVTMELTEAALDGSTDRPNKDLSRFGRVFGV